VPISARLEGSGTVVPTRRSKKPVAVSLGGISEGSSTVKSISPPNLGWKVELKFMVEVAVVKVPSNCGAFCCRRGVGGIPVTRCRPQSRPLQ